VGGDSSKLLWRESEGRENRYVLAVGIVVVEGVVNLSEASAFKASALNEENLWFDVDLGEREFPKDTALF
jgi:hypothetical protein